MKGADWVGLDTNVLVYADDPSSPHHRMARQVLEDAMMGKRHVCLSPQVLAEYYAVITNPHKAKHPLSIDEARRRITFLNRTRKIKKVYPRRTAMKRCMEVCAEHEIRGVRIFDVFYAMTLLDNRVRRLITQNVRDFTFLKQLEVENPFT